MYQLWNYQHVWTIYSQSRSISDLGQVRSINQHNNIFPMSGCQLNKGGIGERNGFEHALKKMIKSLCIQMDGTISKLKAI